MSKTCSILIRICFDLLQLHFDDIDMLHLKASIFNLMLMKNSLNIFEISSHGKRKSVTEKCSFVLHTIYCIRLRNEIREHQHKFMGSDILIGSESKERSHAYSHTQENISISHFGFSWDFIASISIFWVKWYLFYL